MLNKKNLEIVDCATTEEIRGSLCGLHITPTFTQAGNGAMLIRVARPKFDVDEFPQTSLPVNPLDSQYITITKETVKQVQGILPKGKKPILPILENAVVSTQGENGGIDSVSFIAFTGQDIEEQIFSTKTLLPDYPNFEGVFDDLPEKPTLEIWFNPAYMVKLLKHFTTSEPVRMYLFDKGKPILLKQEDAQGITALLMPKQQKE